MRLTLEHITIEEVTATKIVTVEMRKCWLKNGKVEMRKCSLKKHACFVIPACRSFPSPQQIPNSDLKVGIWIVNYPLRITNYDAGSTVWVHVCVWRKHISTSLWWWFMFGSRLGDMHIDSRLVLVLVPLPMSIVWAMSRVMVLVWPCMHVWCQHWHSVQVHAGVVSALALTSLSQS